MARSRRGFGDALEASLAQQQQDAAIEVTTQLDVAPARPSIAANVHQIPVDSIAPNLANPRKDLGDLDSLAGSIADTGILQPITVRPLADADEKARYPEGTRYVLLMGERRWTAARMADLATVPAIVRDDLTDTERQVMILENVQRAELSPVEEARAYADLLQLTGASQRDLARQLHLTQPHISRRLALLDLHPGLLSLVEAGTLGVDVAANELSKLPEPQQAYVLERLAVTDASPVDITPDAVRRHIAQATMAADQLQRLDAQRTWASTHDVTLFEDSLALRDHARHHDMGTTLMGKPSSLAASQLPGLVALLCPLDNEPDLYRLDPRPALQRPTTPDDDQDPAHQKDGHEEDRHEEDQGTYQPTDTAGISDDQDTQYPDTHDQDRDDQGTDAEPASDTAGITPALLSEDKRHKVIEKALAAWVEANPKPPAKAALTQRFAEHIVGTAGRDLTWTVCRWVGHRIGRPDCTQREWDLWRGSLQERDMVTVAWLMTVAADLASSRHQGPGGSAFEATRERVADVLGAAGLQELGMDRQEGTR